MSRKLLIISGFVFLLLAAYIQKLSAVAPGRFCAQPDNPQGYYCQRGQLYGSLGLEKECGKGVAIGESCKAESQTACPDGSDTYCAKGSLCNCNTQCVLPFSLPDESPCCAGAVCKSGFCDPEAHICLEENVTPTPKEQKYESFSPSLGILIVGGVVVFGIYILLRVIVRK